jgi:hypothetical protein
MSKKHPSVEKQKRLKTEGAKQQPKGYKLYRASLYLCLLASILMILEGSVLAFVSPLPFGLRLLWSWGGYADILLGIVVFVGFLVVARKHSHKAARTVAAIFIGFSAITSLILFGGGFYVGFILGLIGAFLTATKDQEQKT